MPYADLRKRAFFGAYTLWVWEGYRWADPSIWHCHRSCREEQQSSGEFSLTLLTRLIAICQVHDQRSSFPTVQWIIQDNLDQTPIEQSLKDSSFHHGVILQVSSSYANTETSISSWAYGCFRKGNGDCVAMTLDLGRDALHLPLLF